MDYFSKTILPMMIFFIIKKVNIYTSFTEGAMEGIKTVLTIFGPMLAIMVGINMFRISGALDILIKLISPIAKLLSIPQELIPYCVMRPVSGGGSLALATDLFSKYGTDSFIGKAVSVLMGSTETTFYTIAVYFGAVGIKNIRYSLKCALLADLVGIIVSIAVTRLFFT